VKARLKLAAAEIPCQKRGREAAWKSKKARKRGCEPQRELFPKDCAAAGGQTQLVSHQT